MVAIDFPSFMELRFIDMKEKKELLLEWLLTGRNAEKAFKDQQSGT